MAIPALPEGGGVAAEAQAPQRERKALARRILLDALFLGGLADTLLREGPGVGFFIWVAVFVTIVLYFGRRRSSGLTREQVGWLAAILFFADCFVWRDSESLLFYDFMAMVAASLILGATLSAASPMRTILGQRLRDVAQAMAVVMRGVFGGVVPAFRESELGTPREWRAGRAGTILRATLLTLPVLLVFGALFQSADPLFGKLLAIPEFDVGTLASHVVLVVIFAWLTGGWLRGAFGHGKVFVRRWPGSALTLGSTDVTAILGSVVALFAIFIAVQIRWLFGGEQLVRSTTGLGYAEYARHGFFQLVFASFLVLPVLLGTRALIRDGDGVAVRRHGLLATPLIVLIGGVMASALGRMSLYVHYYGLSTDRLYATVFMGWLAIVFAWFGLTIVRGRTRDFAAGMAITGFLTLAGLNVLNPESFVARANVARAAEALQVADSVAPGVDTTTRPSRRTASAIDYWYLTVRLDGDAVDHVVRGLAAPPIAPLGVAAREAEIRARCDAARRLLNRWGPHADARDWRRWNFGAWRARTAVLSHENELRAVSCWDAAGEQPFGTRERRAALKGEQDYIQPQGS